MHSEISWKQTLMQEKIARGMAVLKDQLEGPQLKERSRSAHEREDGNL